MYGRTSFGGKWHTFDGDYAHCSSLIQISEKRPFFTKPDGMCERCSKKNLMSVEKEDDGGVSPMKICLESSTISKYVPKTVKDYLWVKEYGTKAGEARCFVCPRTIYATSFYGGYIIPIKNGGVAEINNLKCICYHCHKLQGSQGLEEYINNFYSGKYDNKTIKQPIPKDIKTSLWNITFGSNMREANCYVCTSKITSSTFQAGHILAESKGGTISLDNLKCICSTCNQSMGNRHLEEFKKMYF